MKLKHSRKFLNLQFFFTTSIDARFERNGNTKRWTKATDYDKYLQVAIANVLISEKKSAKTKLLLTEQASTATLNTFE